MVDCPSQAIGEGRVTELGSEDEADAIFYRDDRY
jgi:hypothetical protein